jgi:hypothetical protein
MYTNNQNTLSPLVTDFQQNPENTAIETAADLFLNWVFRLNSEKVFAVDTCASTPVPLSNHWTGDGFRNLEWPIAASSFVANSLGLTGSADSTLPGDRRYFAFDTFIRQLFSTNGW